jgi:H+/gluconate symporter-like permease
MSKIIYEILALALLVCAMGNYCFGHVQDGIFFVLLSIAYLLHIVACKGGDR